MKTRRLVIIFAALMFVLLLVVLGSVIFSVKNVNAHCFNDTSAELVQSVADSGGDMRGSNIFLMSAKKHAARIDGEVEGIKVINIERKFPNSVWIHFVKIVPIFAVQCEDGSYISVDNDLTVCETGLDGQALRFGASVQAFDENPQGVLIPLKISGAPLSPAVKQPLALTGNQNSVLSELVYALNRLDYIEYDFLRLIGAIDLSRTASESGKLFLTMRQSEVKNPGRPVQIEIWNSGAKLLNKMQYAVTLYEDYLRGDIDLTADSIKVYEDSKGIIHAAA